MRHIEETDPGSSIVTSSRYNSSAVLTGGETDLTLEVVACGVDFDIAVVILRSTEHALPMIEKVRCF